MKIGYPNEVEDVIRKLLTSLKKIFNKDLVCVYLHGSLATGEFDIKSSDIDYVVVLKTDINEIKFNALETMHKQLMNYSDLHKRLEGSYITKETACSYEVPKDARVYYNEGRLVRIRYGSEWFFEKDTLIKYGRHIYGETLFKTMENVKSEDISEAAKSLLLEWWKPLLMKQDGLSDEYVVYGVLTMCRILFSIQTGETTSKKEAANWTVKSLYPDMKEMIDEALKWKKGSRFNCYETGLKFIGEVVNNGGLNE